MANNFVKSFFKVTSISELAKIKGKTLENGVVYRNIK